MYQRWPLLLCVPAAALSGCLADSILHVDAEVRDPESLAIVRVPQPFVAFQGEGLATNIDGDVDLQDVATETVELRAKRADVDVTVRRSQADESSGYAVTVRRDAGNVGISVEDGAGAWQLLRVLGNAAKRSRSALGTQRPVVAVWRDGEGSDCSDDTSGCFLTLDNTIHLSGLNDSAWYPSVALHELGHEVTIELGAAWAAGAHSFLFRVPASLAWSEGIATFTGQWLFGDPTFRVPGLETTLDCNLAGGADPTLPLDQDLNEFSVASFVWCLALDEEASVLRTLTAGIRDRRGAVGIDLVDFLDAWVCAQSSGRATALAREMGLPYSEPPTCP